MEINNMAIKSGLKSSSHSSCVSQRKTQIGFTLIELITVVAIVSLLVVYLSIKLGSSNEDARVGMSTTFLVGNVPTAIGAYKARHMSSCKSLEGKDKKAVRAELLARGLAGTTPWNVEWQANYFKDDRRLLIVFPLKGSEDPQAVADSIISSIYDAPQIEGVKANASSTDVPTSFPKIDLTLDKDGKRIAPQKVENIKKTGSIQVSYSCN